MGYIPLLSLVQLGYPAITNTFGVNQIIRYNGVYEHFFGTATLRYSGVPLYYIEPDFQHMAEALCYNNLNLLRFVWGTTI